MIQLSLIVCLALNGSQESLGNPDLDSVFELRDELEELTLPLLKEYRAPGMAMLLIVDGKVAWFHSVGSQELKTEKPFTLDTVFNVASISKCVAAIGHMQLAERGVFDLDQPVNERLKSWKVPRSRYGVEGVTLRRILSHTAGLTVSGFHSYEEGKREPDLIEFLKGKRHPNGTVRLKSTPGDECSYSSGGYAIAELLLKEQTGRGLAEYMRTEVLEPLGMTSSEYLWSKALKGQAAPPLDRRGRVMKRKTYSGAEGAGLFSTPADMARLAIACMPLHRSKAAEEVISTDALRTMQSSVLNSEGFGMGFQRWVYGRRRIVGHTGGTFGGISSVMLDPLTGDGLVLLSNATNSDRFMGELEEYWGQWLAKRHSPRVAESVPSPEDFWVGRPIVDELPKNGEQQPLQWLSIRTVRRHGILTCEIRSPVVEPAELRIEDGQNFEFDAVLSGRPLHIQARLEEGGVAPVLTGTYTYGDESGVLSLVNVMFLRNENLTDKFDGEWESAGGAKLSISGTSGVRLVRGLDADNEQLFAPISFTTLIGAQTGSNLYPIAYSLEWMSEGHLRLESGDASSTYYFRSEPR